MNDTKSDSADHVPAGVPSEHPHHGPQGIKKYFLYTLIGGLVISAVLSIVAVLVGHMTSIIGRALLTTLLIVIHALIALAFISASNKRGSGDIIINTLFGAVIVSFGASVLGIWKVISGPHVADTYAVIVLAFFASLIAEVLVLATKKDTLTRNTANASLATLAILFLLFIPPIYSNNPLADIYWRIIAAFAIILGTLSVLTAIFHRLYQAKHPAPIVNTAPIVTPIGAAAPVPVAQPQHHLSTAAIVLIVIGSVIIAPFVFVFLIGIFASIIGLLNR